MTFRTTAYLLVGLLLVPLLVLACSSDADEAGGESAGPAAAAASDAAGQPADAAGEYKIQQAFPVDIEMTSTVFNRIRRIPVEYTCTDNVYYPATGTDIRYGEDKSPPLAWAGAPDGATSFAIILDDPDVAIDEGDDSDSAEEVGPHVHWVVWNIPADVTELAERVATTTELASIGSNTRQGTNDYGNIGYSGPCPPPNLTATFGPRSGDYSGEGGGLRKQSPHGYMFRVYALDTDLDLAGGATKNDLLKAMEGHILSGGELKGEYVNKRIFK
jgi:hypothetical protein